MKILVTFPNVCLLDVDLSEHLKGDVLHVCVGEAESGRKYQRQQH